jgi:hypothetical protein
VPPRPPEFGYRPFPGSPPARLLWTAAAVGVLGAVVLVAPRPGIGVPLVALAASVALRAVPGRRPDRRSSLLVLLAVLLTGVAAVRASGWLVGVCLAAAAALLALALTRPWQKGTWVATLLALPAFAGLTVRAGGWAARSTARARRPAASGAWARGALAGLAAAAVVGGLLASADPVFGRVFTVVLPPDPWSGLVRVLAGVLAAGGVLGIGAALAAPVEWAADEVAGPAPRHPAEWVVPLALVDAVLALWVAVKAAVLFGARDPRLTPAGDTYASRVHQGFGQLVGVTLVVIALLAWASRRAGDGGPARRVLLVAGGAQVVLGLVVVGSALQRLWQYDQAYGWTVLRWQVGAVEVWLGLVLVGCALAWVVRRTSVLPAAVPVAAGLALLAVAVADPEQLVARWNVERFVSTGRIDVAYLRQLSDDAVPALDRLKEPYRSCVLGWMPRDGRTDPWYGWNLARSRAEALRLAEPSAVPVALALSGSCDDGDDTTSP